MNKMEKALIIACATYNLEKVDESRPVAWRYAKALARQPKKAVDTLYPTSKEIYDKMMLKKAKSFDFFPNDKKQVKTPRGTFEIRFKTMVEANEAGFYLWFTHDGYQIVGDCENHAAAVDIVK